MLCKVMTWLDRLWTRLERWKAIYRNEHAFHVLYWARSDYDYIRPGLRNTRLRTRDSMTYIEACSLADTFGGEVIYDYDGTVVFSSEGIRN